MSAVEGVKYKYHDDDDGQENILQKRGCLDSFSHGINVLKWGDT